MSSGEVPFSLEVRGQCKNKRLGFFSGRGFLSDAILANWSKARTPRAFLTLFFFLVVSSSGVPFSLKVCGK